MSKRLFISFSGGETSALMTLLLTNKYRHFYDEVTIVFANTGQENEETLEFVNKCQITYQWDVKWVECVVHPGRKGCTHEIVNYITAARNGEPFEKFIKKYGIPNAKFPACTRELKMNPMKSYIQNELGWKKGTYDTAIGIRADEPQRRSNYAKENKLVYPLLDWEPMTKADVNTFWKSQPFRLNLAGYQGNCKWCWKKSFRKLMTIMDDDQSIFDFPDRMEKLYGNIGPEFKKSHVEGYRRTFFRNNLSTMDLRKVYYENIDSLVRAENDAVVYNDKIIQLDAEIGDGCTESCEVTWDN